jgi:hypothetical protein
MIKDLAKLATRLDRLGLTKEADVLDSALQKLAQEVATRGAPGATYSEGRQVSPTVPGGKRVSFYKAKPSTISEFNAFLGSLIKEFAANPIQKTFSKAVIANAPSGADKSWSLSKTQPAFKEYARAAGFPEAAANWEAFANANNYAPNMFGIYQFWADTIDEVEAYRGRDQEEYFAKFMDTQGKALAESPQTAGATGEQKPRGTGVLEQGGYRPSGPYEAAGLPDGAKWDASGRIDLSNHYEAIKSKYGFRSLDGSIVQQMKGLMKQSGYYNPTLTATYDISKVWDREFNNAYTTLVGIVLSKAEKNQSDPTFVKMIQGGGNAPIKQIISGLKNIAVGISGTSLNPEPMATLRLMLQVADNPWFSGTSFTPEQLAASSKELLEDDENPFAAGATGTSAPPSYKPPPGGKPGAVKIQPPK